MGSEMCIRDSVNMGKKVSDIILETLPNTIILAIASILIASVVGIFLGVISAIFKNSKIDIFIQFISTIGMSVPSFFSAILFAWFFGYILKEYTGLNMTGSLYELDDYGESLNLKLKNLILPAIVLGIRPLAVLTQLMRNELLNVLAQDYIRTARAKGLTERKIILKHVLRPALTPVITSLGLVMITLINGALFVELIFNIPGFGKMTIDAIRDVDHPLIMSTVLVGTLVVMGSNLIVDLIYFILDPRINN